MLAHLCSPSRFGAVYLSIKSRSASVSSFFSHLRSNCRRTRLKGTCNRAALSLAASANSDSTRNLISASFLAILLLHCTYM